MGSNTIDPQPHHWHAPKWVLRFLRFQVWVVLTVLIFLGLNQWAAWQLRHGKGIEESQEYLWLDSDSCPEAPWMREYVGEFGATRTQWKPYVYWQRRPMSGKYIHIDDQGRRLTASTEKSPATGEVVVVRMFGGSTMWGEGVRDEHTVPSEVQRLLREAGVNARVVNEGEGGYVSTQEMIRFLLCTRQRDSMDVAVFLDGLNDVYSAWENRQAGIPQNESNRTMEFNLASSPARMVLTMLKGGHEGWSIFRLLRKKLPLAGHGSGGTDEADEVEVLARETWRVYEQNVRFIKAVAEGVNVRTAFFVQPSIFEKKNATAFEERVRGLHNADLRRLYERTYELAAARCRERPELGIEDVSHCLDATAEPRFMDFFHLNEKGNAEVAAAIVERLLPVIRARDKGARTAGA